MYYWYREILDSWDRWLESLLNWSSAEFYPLCCPAISCPGCNLEWCFSPSSCHLASHHILKQPESLPARINVAVPQPFLAFSCQLACCIVHCVALKSNCPSCRPSCLSTFLNCPTFRRDRNPAASASASLLQMIFVKERWIWGSALISVLRFWPSWHLPDFKSAGELFLPPAPISCPDWWEVLWKSPFHISSYLWGWEGTICFLRSQYTGASKNGHYSYESLRCHFFNMTKCSRQ